MKSAIWMLYFAFCVPWQLALLSALSAAGANVRLVCDPHAGRPGCMHDDDCKQFPFCDFRPLGATPDPARLGAQVVSGVGFLGAGTIMREGLSIKGLTTAASIWAVACLGLAAGAGYYVIALTGAGAVYATLTVFESVQRKMNVSRHTTLALDMECTDLSGVMHDLNRFALQENATLSHVQFDETEQRSVYHLTRCCCLS